MWQWSQPELDYLQRLDWEATEKVDGTNIRVMWDVVDHIMDVRFGGKTDESQMPTKLLRRLQELFTAERMEKVFNLTPACLYGEGYGAGIQSGGIYIPDRQDFILFDVKIGDWWLKRPDMEEIAKTLGIKIVPVVDYMTLEKAVRLTETGMPSLLTPKPQIMEGLVLRPQVELKNRKGDRIMTKVKHKDFRNAVSGSVAQLEGASVSKAESV